MDDHAAPSAMRKFQLDYGKYLRDPSNGELPKGVPARRSEIYESLLFNNISGFVNKCFPVSKSIFGDEQWPELIRSFFRDWRCETPIFGQIPYEFVQYISDASIKEALPPWLPELLHYEWVELEVDLCDPVVETSLDLYVNPTAKLLAYQWPVHKISKTYQPSDVEQTCLVVFRNQELKVSFVELNPTTFMLLQYLQEHLTGGGDVDALLLGFAEHIQHPEPKTIVGFGKALISDFVESSIIIKHNIIEGKKI